MGNNSSRNQEYYNSIKQESDIDPYEIFGLTKNFEWEELKTAYRRVAKLVHPDKGGSEILFNKVSEAFKVLAKEYKARESNRQYGELKGGYKEYIQNNMPKISENDDNFLDKFNRTFDENRFEDDNAIGYGDIMEKSSKVREDINLPKIMNKFNNDVFNKTFEQKVTVNSKQITKYSDPQPLPLAKSIQYTELGGDKPADFSSTNEGVSDHRNLQYTDYMVAHTTSRLIDPNSIKSRKEYKSVSEYEKSRDKIIKKPPTEEELRYAAKLKEAEERNEIERLNRLKKRDQQISNHHEKVNRLLVR